MHLSPALVSISMFALPIFTGAAPIPQADGGSGGDSYSGAGGNAAGGNGSTPKCDQSGFGDIGLGFLSGNGVLSGNGGNGGSANSGVSMGGNGGNGSNGGGFGGGPTVKLAHYHPNDQQGNNNDGNNTDPNGNPDDGFHPYGKNFLGKGKNRLPQGDGGDLTSNTINTSGSTVTYVAGAGGNAYSGAGGNISGSNTSGQGAVSGPLGGMTHDPDFNSLVDADALNGSNTNVLSNLLGSSSSSFNANNGQNTQNQSQTASANSGPAIAGDGGSINL